MTAGLRFFYRHIHVTGLENIPAKGPAIIIANHASSLMDAALLGILLKRPACFFARGDVFVNKPVQKILLWLHMMPVHDHTEGRHTLGANNDSFSEGRRILSNGGVIVFFPESTSHPERQLLSFRKGIFRLAFKTAAESNFAFEIPVIPVGITYEHPIACRTDVLVHAGQPLFLSAYKNFYKENEAAALLRISKDAHSLMIKQVLHIENKNRLQTAEHYLIIYRNNYPANTTSWKIKSGKKLEQEQIICKYINNTTEIDFGKMKPQSDLYFNELAKYMLNDKTLSPSFFFAIRKKILLWIGFPFYLMGLLFNGLPVLIARKIVDTKVYRADFYSWIFVGCYSLLYFLWLITLVIFSLFLGWQYCIALLLLMIFSGIFAYVYKDWLKDSAQQKKLKQLGSIQVDYLKKMRSDNLASF
jgi:1-acyl-sn-glycerol-3-phosphate acyltransferase